MEGDARPRQRTLQVLRTFNPTRLQDDLVAASYDRLLQVEASVGTVQGQPRKPRLRCVPAEDGQLAPEMRAELHTRSEGRETFTALPSLQS
jgi:hypothetical protein